MSRAWHEGFRWTMRIMEVMTLRCRLLVLRSWLGVFRMDVSGWRLGMGGWHQFGGALWSRFFAFVGMGLSGLVLVLVGELAKSNLRV